MLYRGKLHFNVLVHKSLSLGNGKDKLETGSDLCFVERLMSTHLPDPDLLPHCPMKQRKFLINCLRLSSILDLGAS